MVVTKTVRIQIDGVDFDLTYQESDDTNKWRLIYTDTEVLQLIEGGGILRTIHNIFVGNSKHQCIAEAIRLNLIEASSLGDPNNRRVTERNVHPTRR